MPPVVTVKGARIPADLEPLRTLLREYATHLITSVGPEHLCLSTFEAELTGLPHPFTALLLATVNDGSEEHVSGCVLFKNISQPGAFPDENACEMKRLWVRPQYRGLGIGRLLVMTLLDEARRQGFSAMYLDTLPAAMKVAHAIYLDLGFQAVERYNDNPVPDVVFYRREL